MTGHRTMEQIKRDVAEEIMRTGSALIEERELAAAAVGSGEGEGEQVHAAANCWPPS